MRTPSLDSPEARYVYEYHRQWFERAVLADWQDLAHISLATAPDGFLNGRVAMMSVGPWWGGSIQDAKSTVDWDIALIPKAPTTGKRPYVVSGSGMAITSAGKNKDLAYHFAKQVIMLDGAREIARKTGSLLTNRLASIEYTMRPDRFPGISRNVLLEAPNYALLKPKGVFWDALYGQYNSNMTQFFRGLVPLDEAITNAETAMRAKLQSLNVIK